METQRPNFWKDLFSGRVIAIRENKPVQSRRYRFVRRVLASYDNYKGAKKEDD